MQLDNMNTHKNRGWCHVYRNGKQFLIISGTRRVTLVINPGIMSWVTVSVYIHAYIFNYGSRVAISRFLRLFLLVYLLIFKRKRENEARYNFISPLLLLALWKLKCANAKWPLPLYIFHALLSKWKGKGDIVPLCVKTFSVHRSL